MLPLFHRDRHDQLHRHLDVVPRHHHLHPLRQPDRSRHIRRAHVQLRPVPVEERRGPPPLFLPQHVHLRLKPLLRPARPPLPPPPPPLHLPLTPPPNRT